MASLYFIRMASALPDSEVNHYFPALFSFYSFTIDIVGVEDRINFITHSYGRNDDSRINGLSSVARSLPENSWPDR